MADQEEIEFDDLDRKIQASLRSVEAPADLRADLKAMLEAERPTKTEVSDSAQAEPITLHPRAKGSFGATIILSLAAMLLAATLLIGFLRTQTTGIQLSSTDANSAGLCESLCSYVEGMGGLEYAGTELDIINNWLVARGAPQVNPELPQLAPATFVGASVGHWNDKPISILAIKMPDGHVCYVGVSQARLPGAGAEGDVKHGQFIGKQWATDKQTYVVAMPAKG